MLHVRPLGQLYWSSQSREKTAALIFGDILESICTGSKHVVSQFTEVVEHELEKLWSWNSPVPPRINRCIHEYFVDNAKRYPSKQAVISWDGELSYEQVDRLSFRLSAHLIDLGVTIGTAIPLCFEKSIWTIVGVLAVLRAGGALVLTDPSQPEERLRTIVAEVGATCLLTSNNQVELASRIASGAKLVAVGPHLLRDIGSSVNIATLPDVPCTATLYIQFTSGSTGKPKGVVISHSNYTSGAIPRAEAVGYTSSSRVLDFPSYAFDVSFDCMLCTLAAGGTICEPSEQERLNDMNGAIKRMNANMAHMTPSVARILTTDVISSLDTLGLGGEAASASDLSVWSKLTNIIIAYGPSECTVGCTINNEVDPNKKAPSIGKGVGGTTWIVDPEDHDSLAPIGAVGELLVEGPIVGPGYLNNPQLTSTVFIEDPKWLLSGTKNFPGRRGRLYKTGDLVRYDFDDSSTLVFVGRRDQQVKIRGQRVELEEIEYHLRSKFPQHVGVAAELIVPKDGSRDPILVAFVAEQGEDQEADGETVSLSPMVTECLQELNEYLSSVLPRYMVPTTYIPLRKIPLLVSCKTDRKTLRLIGSKLTRESLAKFRVSAPAANRSMTNIEITLSGAWKDILGSDSKVGLQDDFFTMGGDSLKAMKLVSSLRAKGISLTVGDIFSSPALADMAAAAKTIDGNVEQANVPPFSLLPEDWTAEDARIQVAELCQVQTSSIEDVYPCSPLQEGFMALSAKVSGAYVAQRVVELPDRETASKLRTAFDQIVSDQPVLRTRIVQVPGRGLMQVVIREPLFWDSVDDLQAYLQFDRERPMELNKPLSRLAFITVKGSDKVRFVWTIHHALYDGWSMPLVVKRINEAYRGLKTKSPTPYNAFIKAINSVDSRKSKTYWFRKLQGATRLQFPVVPVPGYQVRAQSLLEHYVPLPLKSVSSSTSIANAIRGAWALTAGLYTSSNDVIFGETLTGRNAPVPGIEDIEGPTITTVPVRIRINKGMTISEYLRDIMAQTAERIPHEHFGLQHIRRVSLDAREACELRTGIVIHPPMEVEEREGDQLNNPASGFIPADDIEAAREALNFNSFGLMLVFSLDADGFLIMASFDSNLIDVAHMKRILECFGETVQQVSRFPQKRLEELNIFAEQSSGSPPAYNTLKLNNLAECEDEELASISNTITSTWIVDPSDPERLLPPGAVGELLVQSSTAKLEPLATIPHWLPTPSEEAAGHESKLYHTRRLVRYRSDGTIMFVKLHEREAVELLQISEAQDPVESTDKERKMAMLWSRILGIPQEQIHHHSSFFDLGGDSILAMRLANEARLESLKLTVAHIFNLRLFGPIVSHTEEEVEVKEPQNEKEADVAFSLLDEEDPESFVSASIKPTLLNADWKITDAYPVRPLQRIAVNGTIKLPRYSSRYENIYFDSPVDLHQLQRSCEDLVARNEILRTVFVESNGEYLGVVLEALDVTLHTYETDGDIRQFVQRFCHLDAEMRMPLGSAFVKFFFVQGVDQQSCLILRISHAQYDEICLPVLLEQLSALYEGRLEGIEQCVPFSSHVRHVLRHNIPRSAPYWRELLQGSAMSIIRPSTPIVSREHFAISREFNISGRPSNVTIATLPTAAWALCLAKRLSSRDVVFGEVVSGRNIGLPHTDPVMGPCWQYVPVRVKFEPHWTGFDLLGYVQNQHINSAPYEGIGLSEIIKNCAPKDWLSGAAGTERAEWFDSVVHQDVRHVEHLPFRTTKAELETIYAHEEPLREWKIQAFPGKRGDDEILSLEIVTFESWRETARDLLDELEGIVKQLMKEPGSLLFG